jgi:hypothetical protein
MPTFHTVTDLNDIARHNSTLNALARNAFPRDFETARLRAPGSDGRPHTVFTENGSHDTLAWYGALGKEGKRYVNLILLDVRAQYEDDASFEILLQINFPAIRRSRPAGRFLVEDETGEIVLAHSGEITRRTRLPVAPVLERFPDELVTTTSGQTSDRVIAIGRLSDVDLIDRICDFAKRMRAVANELGQEKDVTARETVLSEGPE